MSDFRDHIVTSIEALERIYGEPYGPSIAKEADRITTQYRAFIEAALRRHLDSEVGARRRVLAESEREARTEQFTKVRLARPATPGEILQIEIAGHDGRQLLAN